MDRKSDNPARPSLFDSTGGALGLTIGAMLAGVGLALLIRWIVL
jgi:hypothetical protein